jgi:hypothetical protein
MVLLVALLISSVAGKYICSVVKVLRATDTLRLQTLIGGTRLQKVKSSKVLWPHDSSIVSSYVVNIDVALQSCLVERELTPFTLV